MSTAGAGPWNFSVGNGSRTVRAAQGNACNTGAVTGRMAQGIRTSANAVYVVNILSLRKGTFAVPVRGTADEIAVERGLVKPFLQGKED